MTVRADVRKPIPRFDGVFGEPEQQPEAPLGIQNAVPFAKGTHGNCHSGHGRLYRPQATLARPPRSGVSLTIFSFYNHTFSPLVNLLMYETATLLGALLHNRVQSLSI